MNFSFTKNTEFYPIAYLSIFGFTHALVDASSAAFILSGLNVSKGLFYYILLYNILAFGLQAPLGLLVDNIRQPVFSAFLGCIVLAVALFFGYNPLSATIFAGIGNALFHVGGGTVALNLKPTKAIYPGIFVAPGGIGITLGVLLATAKLFNPNPFIILLLIAALGIFIIKCPKINYVKTRIKGINWIILAIFFVQISIVIRSLIGLTVSFPWKSNIILLFLLTITIAFGKALGGYIADKFGWMKIAVFSLIISSPMLAFGAGFPIIAIIGIFLFNLTMPVTLVVISNLLPGRPGFSFGLTTLALIIGALPTFFHYKYFFTGNWDLLILVLFSALAIFIGLWFYNKIQAMT